jgi:hypothetical protein
MKFKDSCGREDRFSALLNTGRLTMRTLAVALVFVSSAAALAQQGPPRGPPPEALAACSGLSDGAACSFSHGDRNLTGTCRSGPQGSALACAPAGMGPGSHHGPPPESLAACQGQADGASCNFTIEGHALSGTCRTHPQSGTIACAPAGMHQGPPPEALAACASLASGAACTVSFNGQTLEGTCVGGPSGEALACRPPRP